MWDKVVSFFFSQGILGIIIVCLSTVIILFYNELKKDRKERLDEIKDTSAKFTEIVKEVVKNIAENTSQLKDLRSETKEHRENSDKGVERLVILMDQLLREISPKN